MSVLVRIVALVLSLVVITGPVVVALFVASVEPSRPVQASWVAPFALGGFASALGYLAVVFVPKWVATSGQLRVVVACLMAIPCVVAVYLLSVTGSLAMVGLSLIVIGGTAYLVATCVWPAWLARSNPSFKRDA